MKSRHSTVWILTAALLATSIVISSCRKPAKTYRIFAGKEGYTHLISRGETLESLAQRYYGDAMLGKALGEYNGVDPMEPLKPGTTLLVPFDRAELEKLKVLNQANMLYNKGTVLARTGQYEDASRHLESAVESNPAHVDAWYNLALVYNKLEKPQRAHDILRKLVNSFPSEETYHYGLGAALRLLGRDEDAVDQFKQAVEIAPEYREAHYALALGYETAGKRKKALQAWERYLELDQESVWAEEARVHIERLRNR